MNIESAKEILNEVVITEPSIKGYTYISAEDINYAINIVLKSLDEKEKEIAKLNRIRVQQEYNTNKINLTDTLLNKVGKQMLLGKTTSILKEI